MKNFKLRIGITMRVTEADNYYEKRDAIAQDWSEYLYSAFSDAQWMFIPNIGNRVVDYVEKWDLNAFVLSGGEDIGRSPDRDVTERAIFDYAIKNTIPLLGICRGLQAIYLWSGGKYSTHSAEFERLHVAKKHKILINNSVREVNSYHQNKLDENSLPKTLKILATCVNDKSIEAVTGENILAMMWHPEREKSEQTWELELIKKHLKMD